MLVQIVNNLLTSDELNYVLSLIEDKSKWNHRTSFDDTNKFGEKLWYDSIFVDNDKLKEYNKKITENGKYSIIETAINIIQPNRLDKNNKHQDHGDLSFVTYLNEDYTGGRLFYYDENDIKHIIEPKFNLSVKINYKTAHEVEEVETGIRYSLYTFLEYVNKETKTLM